MGESSVVGEVHDPIYVARASYYPQQIGKRIPFEHRSGRISAGLSSRSKSVMETLLNVMLSEAITPKQLGDIKPQV